MRPILKIVLKFCKKLKLKVELRQLLNKMLSTPLLQPKNEENIKKLTTEKIDLFHKDDKIMVTNNLQNLRFKKGDGKFIKLNPGLNKSKNGLAFVHKQRKW